MNKNLRSGTKKDMKPPELFVASENDSNLFIKI
jgi:hypothetical protein